MTRDEVFAWVLKEYGTEPEYPWHDQNAVLRQAKNNKWYGAVLNVGRDKLGLSGAGYVDVINVKCDPFLVGSLRTREGFHPAYHMNKDKWISIRLDGSVEAKEVKSLIAASVELTGPKKKVRKSDDCEKE